MIIRVARFALDTYMCTINTNRIVVLKAAIESIGEPQLGNQAHRLKEGLKYYNLVYLSCILKIVVQCYAWLPYILQRGCSDGGYRGPQCRVIL